MTPKPRRLPDALAQSEAGFALLQRHEASQRAAAAIEPECLRIVPEFRAARSISCELRGTTLRLTAGHPAQVAKLRQAVPRLLSLLHRQGLDVIEIKIGVQPRALSSSGRPEAIAESLASAAARPNGLRGNTQIQPALAFARKLVLALPESPLRKAAQRLATSLSGGLARMRESGQPLDQQDGEKHDP
jgi:hypothetical protein